MNKSKTVQLGNIKSKTKVNMEARETLLVVTSEISSGPSDKKDNLHNSQRTTDALSGLGIPETQQGFQKDLESCGVASSTLPGLAVGSYWAVLNNRVESEEHRNNRVDSVKMENLDCSLQNSKRSDISVDEQIEDKMEMVKHAEHNVNLATIDEAAIVLVNQAKLQHEWNVVGSDGKALRLSRRKREEKSGSYKKAKRILIKGVTNRNNAVANITTTTITTKNNNSILQNKYILKNNKNLDRITNKERKSTEAKANIVEQRSPMLFNLDKAITRAQESMNSCKSTTLSDPLHKNEEKVVKTMVKSSINDGRR
jgi:hypothetical protein